jgi:signal transduction histidine kinase
LLLGSAEKMAGEINCPRCGQPLSTQNRYCEKCGADSAVAVVLAEQQIALPTRIPSGVPVTPEVLVPRIGDYMIKRGMLKPEELQFALRYQKQCSTDKHPILLGQALLELKLVDRETLDQIVTAQILELQNALNEANQTLQKRVEERTRELQKALERLSEINQLKSNFIANISHELRTPLTHIKGYLEILDDGGLGSLTPAQKEALNVLKRAEVRLEGLIEDLLQFSLSSRGELSLNLQKTNIITIIKTAVDRYHSKAKTKSIDLIASVSENLPLVLADEEKIGWVILQLIDNALKFTHQGGKVCVDATEGNGRVTISVSDTGIGIPKKQIPEIFEPFHQLDGSSTRNYSGTGLGLAMVRRIIEAHGSQINVDSVVNAGSRFKFWLPITKLTETTKTRVREK